MTKLVALFILALACVFAQTAQTPAVEGRWEYSVVDTQLGNLNSAGRYVGTVKICFATEQGCREELITVMEARKSGSYNQDEAAATDDRAVAKALAHMGRERWELVSVTQRSLDGNRILGRTFYFKRRVP